jgi:hypothetical protein
MKKSMVFMLMLLAVVNSSVASTRFKRPRSKAAINNMIAATVYHGSKEDAGYPEGRMEVDFDGDGVRDFCRVIGTQYPNSYVACNLLDPSKNIVAYVESGSTDWGYPAGRTWTDVNGDGRADYCRVIGTDYPNSFVACTLSEGKAFGQTYRTKGLDWGYPDTRSWIVVNGSPAFCRGIGDHSNPDFECRLIRFGIGLTELESSADFKKP